ncbi:Defective in cullin neddylation protein [Hirschfeldia incana]|nr:Defective in cullin neddylation protein [Hirschfeldia incana]
MLWIKLFCFVITIVCAAPLTDLERDINNYIEVYHKYSSRISNLIEPEGIEKLCSDLDVSCTDIRFLMLAWTMKAEKQGYFTQEEWIRGLMALRADTIDELKKALPELEKEDATKFCRFLCVYLSIFFNRGRTEEHRHRDCMSTPRYRHGIYIPTPS